MSSTDILGGAFEISPFIMQHQRKTRTKDPGSNLGARVMITDDEQRLSYDGSNWSARTK
jgi:hypothetical protein